MTRLARIALALLLGVGLGLAATGPSAEAASAGDWFVWRNNVSSGNYDMTTRVGSTSENHCETTVSSVPYSLARYRPRLVTNTGAIAWTGVAKDLNAGEIDHWIIEPGSAIANSYDPKIRFDVWRWTGGADGHFEFVHQVHIGVDGPYEGRSRLGPPGSQSFVGC